MTEENNTIRVRVTGSGQNAGAIRATNDRSEFWSNKAKDWAISDEMVDNTDYSSKHYAQETRNIYENATGEITALSSASINDIESFANSAKEQAIHDINIAKGQAILGNPEIPVCFGAYSDVPLGDNWVGVYSDETVLQGNDYLKLYTFLKNVLNGTIYSADIPVCSPEEYNEMLENATDDTYESIKLELAYYYVVDIANETIKLPQILRKNKLIGSDCVEVIAWENNTGGVYVIYSNGNYEEHSFIARLEKATKTVNGSSVTYYKVTDWDDSESAKTLTTSTENGTTIVTTSGSFELSYPLVSEKNRFYLYSAVINPNADSETELGNVIKQDIYGYSEITQDDEQNLDYTIRVYDGQYSSNANDSLSKHIPTGYNEAYLICTTYGKVSFPSIEDYNLGYNLYIKVA